MAQQMTLLALLLLYRIHTQTHGVECMYMYVYLIQWHSQKQEGSVPVHAPEDVQVRFLLPVRV